MIFFKKRALLLLCAGLFSQPLMAFITQYNGVQIEAQGKIFSKNQQDKITQLLVSNPASLLSDIDFALEDTLKSKRQKLESKKREVKARKTKRKYSGKLAKIQRMLESEVGFVHEDFIYADILNDILEKNPHLVNIFAQQAASQAEKKKKAVEAELYQTKGDFERAFNKIVALEEAGLTYAQYQLLKENYKGNPFFKLIHNIRECIGCGMARISMPFIRAYLETKVTDYVTKNFPDKNKQITITDFASGNLFEIFVILNKLAVLGYTNIRLNLIDLEFQGVIRRYTQTMQPNAAGKFVIKPGTFELSPGEIDRIASLYTNVEGKTEMGSQDIDVILKVLDEVSSDTAYNNTFAYFSQWFNGTNLKLDIVIYGDGADYIADSAANPERKADILIGVDSYTTVAGIFDDLRKKTLKDTGMAFSIEHNVVKGNTDADTFYFSVGSQKQIDMQHFEWDLKAKKLKPVKVLPGDLEFHLSEVHLADLFKES